MVYLIFGMTYLLFGMAYSNKKLVQRARSKCQVFSLSKRSPFRVDCEIVRPVWEILWSLALPHKICQKSAGQRSNWNMQRFKLCPAQLKTCYVQQLSSMSMSIVYVNVWCLIATSSRQRISTQMQNCENPQGTCNKWLLQWFNAVQH